MRTSDHPVLALPESRWVDVGGPVHYLEWDGPAGGPTFVMVHGFGGSALNWALAAPELARTGRVVAPDLPGFGDSPLAGRTADLASNTRLLRDVMRALDIRPSILVGNSMGGSIAMLAAASHPDAVDRLVLVDAAFPRDRMRSQHHTAPQVAAGMIAMSSGSRLGSRLAMSRARRLGSERLIRETLRLCAADPSSIDPALVDAMVDLAERRRLRPEVGVAYAHAARSLATAYLRPDAYRVLVAGIRQPALVIHGLQDRLVPFEFARRAVEGHANWDLVAFADLGHIPMIEAPGRFAAAVTRWLGNAGGAGAASVTP